MAEKKKKKKKPSNRMSQAEWDKYAPRKDQRTKAEKRHDAQMKEAHKRHKKRKL